MKLPLITIVIPVYNKEEYVNKTIESVVNQSYKQLELIIINDGSTDNSGKIIREWSEKDKRIILINQENKGVSETRNSGIDMANGKYIFFLDADDEIKENAIYNLILKAEINKADITVGNFIKVISSEEKKDKELIEKKYTGNELSQEQVKAEMFMIKNRYLATTCNKLYKRQFLTESKVRFKNNVLAEDRLFNLMCYVNYPNIYITNDLTYIYNIIEGSRSRSYSPNLYKSILELYNKLDNYLENKNIEMSIDDLILINISYDIDNIINHEYNSDNQKITRIHKVLESMYYNKRVNKVLKSNNYKYVFSQLQYRKLPLIRRRINLVLLKNKRFKLLTVISIIHRKLIKFRLILYQAKLKINFRNR